MFDGANPHIAGRLTAVNVRFGLPSGSGTLYEPGGEGVLWWSPYRDEARGRAQASLLDRCRASNTCPKIFETFGSAEFNARLFTVALTGTDSKADLPLPSDVRRYYFPGVTHGGDDQGGFVHTPAAAAGCVLAKNPNPEKEQMAALAQALVQWVVRGVEPPPSIFPRLSVGDLAANSAAAMGWPPIPGAPVPDGMAVGLMDYDYGSGLNASEFRGVLSQWPPLDPQYAAGAHAEARHGRQRDRGPAFRPAPGAAGHLHRLERDGRRFLQRPALRRRTDRRLHSVCEDACGAAGFRRSAAVARGALRDQAGVRLRRAQGGCPRGRTSPAAARGCAVVDRAGGSKRGAACSRCNPRSRCRGVAFVRRVS